MDANALAQYNELYNQYLSDQANSSNAGQLAMNPAGSALGLSNFMNSPAYALAYGANQSLDPSQRFLQDQGTQLAIKAGMPLLANSYSAKGLGASGPAANAVAQYMYNNYGNFIGQQQALFGNYQNQLSGLMNSGMGAVNQQASNITNAGNVLAALLSQNYMNSANQQSGNYMNTGSNISSLLAALGSSNASSILGTGSAMANNMMQGSQLGAQIQANQNASNAQTMNSLLRGQGAMNGANTIRGGMF